jgi:hypothetical protein
LKRFAATRFHTGDAVNVISARQNLGATPTMEMPSRDVGVDVIGRSIRMTRNKPPIEAAKHYLGEARTRSAALLAERPVIVVWPGRYRGRVVWSDGKS